MENETQRKEMNVKSVVDFWYAREMKSFADQLPIAGRR